MMHSVARTCLFLPVVGLLLSACSPHPGAGNWTATEENDWGISRLTLSYEGRAMFDSKTPSANWHCFWGGRDARTVQLDCTPSSHADRETQFSFSVDKDGTGILSLGGKALGRFKRADGKPETP